MTGNPNAGTAAAVVGAGATALPFLSVVTPMEKPPVETKENDDDGAGAAAVVVAVVGAVVPNGENAGAPGAGGKGSEA